MLSKNHAPVAPVARSPPRTQHNRALRIIAHVGVAARQPYLHAARDRDHPLRLAFASAVIIARIVERSTGPAIRIHAPDANSISTPACIVDEARGDPIPGPETRATGENAGAVRAALQSCCRQRNNWLT